jgi:hypothetical protein
MGSNATRATVKSRIVLLHAGYEYWTSAASVLRSICALFVRLPLSKRSSAANDSARCWITNNCHYRYLTQAGANPPACGYAWEH